MSRLKRFLDLPAHERSLLVRALFYVVAARACVTFMSFPALCRRLIRTAVPAPAFTRHSPERIAWAVAAAGRLVPGSTCLSESVAAHLLLRRGGWPAVLCLSVEAGRVGGLPFRAHASVESQGRTVIGGPAGEGFTSLARIG
jgi:hypothetical protein